MVFATHALSPAKVSRITIVDPVEKHMEVIVDDSQLSLAIGKKGQNVRLAAKLLGWKIDIKSEEEKRQEVESQMAALVAPGAPVSVLIDYGLAEKVVEKLLEAGIGTIEKLGGMTPEQLEEIQGIGPKWWRRSSKRSTPTTASSKNRARPRRSRQPRKKPSRRRPWPLAAFRVLSRRSQAPLQRPRKHRRNTPKPRRPRNSLLR